MYDDLKRTKHKLIKPYVYDSHSRSAKSIANKALSCRTAVYEVYSQSKTIVLPASIFAKSSLEEDYQFVGYIGKPLTVLRNRLASRSAYVSERLRLFDNRFGGQCTSVILPHYEIFSDCLCTALLGNPICACLGNVSSILKNVEVVESLLRVLGPKPTDSLNPALTSSTSSNSNGCDENVTSASCITPACDVSPRGKEEGVAVSETPGYLSDCSPRRMSQTLSVDDTYGDRCQQDDMLSCLHDDFGSSGDNLYIPADGNGFSNQQEQYSNSRHPCQSEQPTCAFAINGNSYSYTKNYVSESADIIYSCECIPNYQSLSTEDREDILPCLNHNISLKSSSEGEINCGDQFPFDNMMSLCSGSEFTQFDADLLNEQCLSDVSGQSRAPSFNSPGHDFIDTMIDTYTLSKAYCGDRQSSLNGDDGARGDGLHFNLGLHQSWWSNGGDAIPVHSKSCFSVMADPTPQDRLARITYKTQPSDAAQAPMFVFSPSMNLSEKLASSSKAIPLDFNLNAVYKLATQSDRVTEEGRLEEPNSKLIPAVRNMAQGTSSSPDSERQTGVALDSSSQKLPESVEAARDQVLETDKTNSCEDKREEITPCSISDKESQPCTAIPYVVIAVLVAVMATGLFMCTNKNCFSQLFWEILMHLFLVGVLLMLLITALEANNLTERAVRQLQHILRGCRSPQTSRRQFMILPTNSEHKSEIRSDQLFFDTHSSDPEVLEPAKDPDGRTEVQEMRRSGPSESNAAWLAHFPSDAVPVSPLSAVGGGCETDLVKSNIQANIEPFSDDNTNVRSNPEVGGANTIENVSSFSLNSKLCFGALSSCALDSRLKFQDCCSSTRVVLTTKDAATSSMSACCVAQTMTDFTVLESSYTQTDGAARECRTSSGLQTTEGIPGSDLVRTANVSVQAEMDARKVYQHMEKLQQRHQSAMKRLQRKFLAIRRRCQVEAMSLKSSERRKNDLLCKLQLNLPSLQKEKSTLLAERASIDKQFEQEKRKNRELVGRLTRLNQQFYRLGQIQQPPTHQPAPWKQHYQQSSYQSSSANRLPGEQTSQQLQKSNTNQSQHGNLQQGAHQTHPNQPQQVQHKIHQQSTLLQNQIRPSVSSTPQQQNLQQPQQQQQHYYHPQQQQQQQPPQQQPQQLFHQQGLPVFQLFNNKSFCQPYLEAYQQQQQQQQPHQQQIHQQKMQQ